MVQSANAPAENLRLQAETMVANQFHSVRARQPGKVGVTGLRGRSSPMHTATDKQQEAVLAVVEAARKDGRPYLVEVRYSTWVGPGCAADHGDLCINIDGKIAVMVTPEGLLY